MEELPKVLEEDVFLTEPVHINELPAELLAHIFSYLPLPISEPFPFPILDSFHHWKVVTQVCRFWRTTALSTPQLWRTVHISSISDELAIQSLPLSGGLPLEVLYTANLPDGVNPQEPKGALDDKALQGVMDNLDRLRGLHIYTSLAETYSLWKYFTRPAMQLQALTIISGDEADAGGPYVLPPIFNAEMPSLQKLVLANVSLWPHHAFRSLKHLALYDQLDDARLPLHTFLNVLGQSPELESLILVGAGLEDDFIFDSSNLAQPVSLPFLQYIELGEWSFEMIPLTFLKHIIIPEDATLCLWNLGWEANLRNLLFPHPEYESLLRRCTKINITCFLDGDHDCEADTLVGVKGTTIYYYAPAVPPDFSTLRSLGKFTNVTELNYCPDTRWGKHSDIIDEDLLMMLPALKILRVSNAIHSDLERLCRVLIQFDPRPSQISERRKSFSRTLRTRWTISRPRFRIAPLLEELHITHPYDHPDFRSDFEKYTLEDLQPLLLFANVRANNGVMVKKLVIQGHHESVSTSDLDFYFDNVELIPPHGRETYWEDSVSEVWGREKLTRPPEPI